MGVSEGAVGEGDGALAVPLGCCVFSKARNGSSNAMSIPPAPRTHVNGSAANPC
jgi:hypothetical protein